MLVVDAGTRELASTTYLFGRSVGTGAAALRGSTLDRQVPRRAACRLAIAYLEPASPPPALRDALAPLPTGGPLDRSARRIDRGQTAVTNTL